MCLVKPPALWGIGRPGFLSSALRLLHRVNAGPRCVGERAGEGCVVRPMRCGRINALRTGLGLRGPSSAIPDREALRLRTVPRRAPSVWLWFPKAKPCITNANVHRRTAAASWFSFFSRGTRIPKNAPRDTGHIISQILSRLHRRAKTRDAIACSLITVSLSRLTLLNFPSHTVPYTHGHDRVSKVNDRGRACRRRRCSLLCFPHAHRFVIGSSIGSLLCFPLAKAE